MHYFPVLSTILCVSIGYYYCENYDNISLTTGQQSGFASCQMLTNAIEIRLEVVYFSYQRAQPSCQHDFLHAPCLRPPGKFQILPMSDPFFKVCYLIVDSNQVLLLKNEELESTVEVHLTTEEEEEEDTGS